MAGSDSMREPEARDLVADLQYHRDLLSAAQVAAAGLADRVEELHRELDHVRAADRSLDLTIERDEALAREAALQRELDAYMVRADQYAAALANHRDAALEQARVAVLGRANADGLRDEAWAERDRAYEALARAVAERDAARAAGVEDMRDAIDAAVRERDAAREQARRDADNLQAWMAQHERATGSVEAEVERLTRERDEAREQLGEYARRLVELRDALCGGIAPGPLRVDQVFDQAVDAARELAELRDEEDDDSTTPEHDLGVALLLWLADEEGSEGPLAPRLRALVNKCDDGPDVPDKFSEPEEDETDEELRRRWTLLHGAVLPGAWDGREAEAERVRELEADADGELRRLAEVQRETLLDVAAIAETALAGLGEKPRPTAELRDAWGHALRRIVRAAGTRIADAPLSLLASLRRRDRVLRAALGELTDLAERADRGVDDGSPDEARHLLTLLLGEDYDAEAGPLEALLGAHPKGSPWGEDPPEAAPPAAASWPREHPSPDPVDRVAAVAVPALREIAGLVDRPDLAEAVAGPRWTVDLDGGPGGQAARAVVEAVAELRRGRAARADELAGAMRRVADLLGRPELGREVKSWLYGGSGDPLVVVAALEASPLRASLRDEADPGGVVSVLRGVAAALGRDDLVARIDAWHAEVLADLSGRIPSGPPAEVLAAVRARLIAAPPSEVARLEAALAQIARAVGRPDLGDDGVAPQAIAAAVETRLAESPRPIAAVGGEARAEVVVGEFDYRGQGVDLLKRGRQVLWRVRGVTPDSGGAPVELGRAVAPLARREAEAAARRWISEYLARHPERAPPEG